MEITKRNHLSLIMAGIAVLLMGTTGASADTCFSNLIQLDQVRGSLPEALQNADQGIYAIANDGQKIKDGWFRIPIDKGAIAITAISARSAFYMSAEGSVGLIGGIKYPFNAGDSLPQVCANGRGQIYSSTDGVSATVTSLGGGNLTVSMHIMNPIPGVPRDVVFNGRLVNRAQYEQYLDTHL